MLSLFVFSLLNFLSRLVDFNEILYERYDIEYHLTTVRSHLSQLQLALWTREYVRLE
jgi:hypothetical protein